MAKYHSELSRVQIPAVIHLERLGYTYMPHVPEFDHRTNILTRVFSESLKRLNPSIIEIEIKRELDLIVNVLKNDDLGREFYGKLTTKTGGTSYFLC